MVCDSIDETRSRGVIDFGHDSQCLLRFSNLAASYAGLNARQKMVFGGLINSAS
jgi:hypothetical protein